MGYEGGVGLALGEQFVLVHLCVEPWVSWVSWGLGGGGGTYVEEVGEAREVRVGVERVQHGGDAGLPRAQGVAHPGVHVARPRPRPHLRHRVPVDRLKPYPPQPVSI